MKFWHKLLVLCFSLGFSSFSQAQEIQELKAGHTQEGMQFDISMKIQEYDGMFVVWDLNLKVDYSGDVSQWPFLADLRFEDLISVKTAPPELERMSRPALGFTPFKNEKLIFDFEGGSQLFLEKSQNDYLVTLDIGDFNRTEIFVLTPAVIEKTGSFPFPAQMIHLHGIVKDMKDKFFHRGYPYESAMFERIQERLSSERTQSLIKAGAKPTSCKGLVTRFFVIEGGKK